MFIIDEEGKIIEGQELTTEEVSILEELTGGELNRASATYISTRDARLIAKHMVQNYRISRRNPVAAVKEPEPAETYAYPEPIPVPVAISDDDELPI